MYKCLVLCRLYRRTLEIVDSKKNQTLKDLQASGGDSLVITRESISPVLGFELLGRKYIG